MSPQNTNKSVIRDVADLARLFIRIIRDISTQGKNLSTETLTAGLRESDEVKKLLNTAAVNRRTLASPVLEEEVKRLTVRIQDEDRERRKLANTIYNIEHGLELEKDYNKRLVLSLVSLCEILGNNETVSAMSEFKEAFYDGFENRDREKELGKLRTLVMKLDIDDGKETEGKSSLFGRFLKPSVTPLDQMKKMGISMLNDLAPIVGTDFSEKVGRLKERVESCDSLDYFISLRKDLMDIVAAYSLKNEEEMNNITGFIKEIGDRLATLEQSLLESHTMQGKVLEDDMAFNDGISDELKNIGTTVNSCEEITELTGFVIEHINRIGSELENRHEDYVIRIENSNSESDKLKGHFKTIISNLEHKNKILEEQSSKDPLTGIYNRRTFMERLDEEYERYQRYKTPFSLLFFDVDHFKIVNDTYGHEAGDKALKGIAVSSSQILRKTDVLARYGGEEFVVILYETGLEKAVKAAEKLRLLIEEAHFEYDNTVVPITISIGVTEVCKNDSTPSDIVNRADKYLYRAKQTGRNMVMSDKDDPGV